MGNAAFWYRPFGASQNIGINLQGAPQGRDGPFVRYDLSSSTSMAGTRAVRIFNGVERVTVRKTIQRDDITRASDKSKVIRKLRGMIAHLKRGGFVTYSEDIDHMVAAFATWMPADGAGTVVVGNRITSDLAPGISFLDREIVIRSDPDRLLLEERLCDGFTNNAIALDANIGEDFSQSRWVLVRETGTYPALRLPEDALGREDFLRGDGDFTYDLELPLEDDVNELERLARLGDQLGSEQPVPGGDGVLPIGNDSPFDHVVPPYRW